MARGPLTGTTADLADKGIHEDLAVRRMHHLRMKLDTIETAANVLNGSHRGILRPSCDRKASGDLFHMIAMAHPDRAFAVDEKSVKKRAGRMQRLQVGVAIFPLAGRHDQTAKMAGQKLHAVADAQHRHPEFKQGLGHTRRAGFIHRFGAARQNNSLGVIRPDGIELHVKRVQLAVDMGLTDPTSDQLGVLRTEIQDQYFFAVDIHEPLNSLSFNPVVWCLAGDDHVMHMTLLEAGRGDADKLGMPAQSLDVAGADIAHAGAEAADQLVDHGR